MRRRKGAGRAVMAAAELVSRRQGASTYESTAKLNRLALALRLSERAVVAPVLFKLFLSETVKCQCRHVAFEARSDHVPRTMRAAPAGEVITVDPDHAFVHTSLPFACVWDWGSGATGGTHQCTSAEGELLPVATSNFPQSLREAK